MSSVPSSCFTALVGGALGERTEPWETLMSVISDTDSWKSDTKRAEDAGVDEGGTPHVATKKPPSETKKLLNVTMADNQALKKLALHALHRIERTRDIVWGTCSCRIKPHESQCNTEHILLLCMNQARRTSLPRRRASIGRYVLVT